jgi:hypothetical protein
LKAGGTGIKNADFKIQKREEKEGWMTRNGKIARLPCEVRELLNQRLRDGVGGLAVLDWLNGLPEVQEIIQEDFGGVPISKQNLSEWRAGGYREWLRHEGSLDMIRGLWNGWMV